MELVIKLLKISSIIAGAATYGKRRRMSHTEHVTTTGGRWQKRVWNYKPTKEKWRKTTDMRDKDSI
jgi:hypothetical protein